MENSNLIKFYIKNDDTLDIEKIVNDYSNYIFTIIKNITKNLITDEDIEELISDVFLVVWKNKEKLDYNLELKPYIAGISKNISKNKLRSLKIPYICNIESQEEIRTLESTQELVETKEELDIILNELKAIGKDSKIFTMFYFEEKKIKQIANILKLTEFNVSTKLHRIRKRIKKTLESRGYNYGK